MDSGKLDFDETALLRGGLGWTAGAAVFATAGGDCVLGGTAGGDGAVFTAAGGDDTLGGTAGGDAALGRTGRGDEAAGAWDLGDLGCGADDDEPKYKDRRGLATGGVRISEESEVEREREDLPRVKFRGKGFGGVVP